MTLLTFVQKYVVTSANAVTNSTNVLADDTEASQTFTLTATQIVLVIYAANSLDGQTMPVLGMQNAISVDAVDKAKSWDAEAAANYVVRNLCFWIGSLASGPHTIKGRFASNTNGSTATINNRTLLIYIFDGTEFQYIDDATTATTSSSSVIDDPNASVTFTPSASCVLLAMYNCSNSGATESNTGKVAKVSIAAADYGQAEKCGGSNGPDSVFTVHCLSRTAISTVVKGRFGSSVSGTVTIHRRQLGVLLINNSVPFDLVTSTTQVNSSLSTLVDDAQCAITRTPAATAELLVIAMGTKRRNASYPCQNGICYGIKVDTNDRTNSRGAPTYGGASWANSCATAWAEWVTQAPHTVKGRFSNNYDAQTAYVDARQVVALWFPSTLSIPTLTTDAATGLGLD